MIEKVLTEIAKKKYPETQNKERENIRALVKEKEETKQRLIDLRNKVKEADRMRKESLNTYKRALYAYDIKDDDVLRWDEEKRNELTKHRRLRRR